MNGSLTGLDTGSGFDGALVLMLRATGRAEREKHSVAATFFLLSTSQPLVQARVDTDRKRHPNSACPSTPQRAERF